MPQSRCRSLKINFPPSARLFTNVSTNKHIKLFNLLWALISISPNSTFHISLHFNEANSWWIIIKFCEQKSSIKRGIKHSAENMQVQSTSIFNRMIIIFSWSSTAKNILDLWHASASAVPLSLPDGKCCAFIALPLQICKSTTTTVTGQTVSGL